MKHNYTIQRTLSALPLLLLLGIFTASCSKDDNDTSNPETTGTDNTIPEGTHVWEYYSINKDGKTVTVTSELSDLPFNNDKSIYETVYIPSTVNIDGKDYRVTSIGRNAFSACFSLTSISIPESVTSIGNYAFLGCSSLTSIYIPEGATSIRYDAFLGCSSLASITVAVNNPVYDSRGGCNAIIETSSNTLIAGCQNTIIPESVTSIGSDAFFGCSSLTSISIPEGVTSIGNAAFSNCSSLTSISIPEGVTSIGESAFFGCSSLTSISIPKGVTSIGYNAFGNCSSLTSISIPESVTSIGHYTFQDCSSLTSIICYAEKVPIGYNVFSNVPQSKATLYVPASAIWKYKEADHWKDFGKILPIE